MVNITLILCRSGSDTFDASSVATGLDPRDCSDQSLHHEMNLDKLTNRVYSTLAHPLQCTHLSRSG